MESSKLQKSCCGICGGQQVVVSEGAVIGTLYSGKGNKGNSIISLYIYITRFHGDNETEKKTGSPP